MGAMSAFSLQFFCFAVMATALLITPAQANHPHWGETVPYSSPPEKMTKLHFYLHDNLIGSNQTGFRIAEAAITNSSSTFFGATFMVDDPLTEGPDPESRLVGRAQGLFGASGMNETSLIMGLSLVFTADKKFNGSTISVFTRNAVTYTEREFSIVGGTGFFRFARGFISAKTYWTNGFNSIIEWTCTVVHN
ncbi:dirigent protein 2-like [Papaver somniferum]|uniref:dirigent protein 2-like n=1 Tax=Papaver somniferum TaxID=3469 RepID=UPI000E6FD792|nr:dirigent protein 2-like [Papaver somniferum]